MVFFRFYGDIIEMCGMWWICDFYKVEMGVPENGDPRFMTSS